MMKGTGFRSTWAIAAGVFFVVVSSLATDMLLHAMAIFPPWGETMSNALFVLATVYRLVYAILGGYITARFAPDRPVRHAVALGIVGLALSTVGAAATWNRGPALGPHWYPVTLAVTAVPCSWIGGIFRVMRLRGTATD